MDHNHISPDEWKGTLSEEAIKHLAVCPRCREALADYIESAEYLTAPGHLKASILNRSQKLDVQLIAGSNHLSKRLQLFYYSLKVGTAVVCALTLLFMAPDMARQAAEHSPKESLHQKRIEYFSPKHWEYYEHIDQLTKQLNKLSNLNLEVFRYDKEER